MPNHFSERSHQKHPPLCLDLLTPTPYIFFEIEGLQTWSLRHGMAIGGLKTFAIMFKLATSDAIQMWFKHD